jgi:hypothetical protein
MKNIKNLKNLKHLNPVLMVKIKLTEFYSIIKKI